MKDLALAYNLARHNKKKMAKGGMVENEDLNPMHEPGHEVEDKVMSQVGQSHMKEDYKKETIHPAEMKEHVEPKEENLPDHMFYGPKNIVQKIMQKRMMAKGGMCYAQGGVVNDDRTMDEMDEPDYGNNTYPDPDNMEHTEGMEEAPKRKMILSNIMRGIRSRHMGK